MTSIDLYSVLARRPLGLIFDIDGTLSAIAPTPDGARLWPGAAETLTRASQYAHVAILTGRAITDGARIVDVEGLTYIGTHGLEWSDGLPATHPIQLLDAAQPYAQPGRQLFALLEPYLSELPGVILQPKSVGGSVHYRLAPEADWTRKRLLAILEEPARRLGMRLSEGRYIIEILSPLTVHKGEALRRYAQRFELQGVIFAGDDRTDLDAVLEVQHLRQEGLAGLSFVVRDNETLPALLEQGDIIVDGVGQMVAQLQKMVSWLEQQANA